MKLMRKFTAFILAFSMLAGTVAAISAAGYTEDASPVQDTAPFYDDSLGIGSDHADNSDPAAVGANSYSPRLTAPKANNPYYYSDRNIFYRYGWGMPNCTCYAWGRAYEILGEEPALCVYSAYLWYDYNKDCGAYAYGDEPKPGAIACWVYSSGTSGHVAVVERVENGVITFSNSAYSGVEFYTHTAPVDDPSGGKDTWIFQGYIYIGDFEGEPEDNSSDADSSEPQVVGDVYRVTSENGVNLRVGAGTSSPVIGGITYGQTALVTKTKVADGYTWGYTLYEGTYGWFVIDFASLLYTKTQEIAEETPTADDEAERTLMMGDLDSDGEITIVDATWIQVVLAQLVTPTDYMLTVGDYDGDSIFSIMDAGRIRHYLAFGTAR